MKAPRFAERYEQMKQEILADEAVQQFLSAHGTEVNGAMIERSLGKLYEYTTASHACDKCASLPECTNIMKGFEPKLVIKSNLIDIEYMKCPTRLVADDRRAVSKMIDSMYMPKDVMEARLENLDFDGNAHESRLTVIKMANDFLQELDETGELPKRGLYIHGPFGIGKSFILGALANELAERRIRTVAVYVPEFLREIKNAIQDQTLHEKVEYVKKAAVLILDDFGAEAMTTWTRDEILGAILQYRMAEQLPTFFTSNLNYKELEHHLTYTQRGEKDVIKAARIMERIQSVAQPVELYGENRRIK